MKNEISILRNINNNGYTTQRDIARLTGMSLGNVNAAIRSLIEKGYLEKKATTSERDSRYVLTELGIREKSIAALNIYSEMISSAYTIKKNLKEIIKTNYIDCNNKPIIYGEDDEIYKYLVSEIFQNIPTNYVILRHEDLSLKAEDNEGLIIVWHPDYEQILKKYNLNYINILSHIDDRDIK